MQMQVQMLSLDLKQEQAGAPVSAPTPTLRCYSLYSAASLDLDGTMKTQCVGTSCISPLNKGGGSC